MSDTEGYTSTLTADEVWRIRAWHERAYEQAREEAGDGQVFQYFGLTLHVPPTVQPITGMSHLLGEAVLKEARPGDRVLDMGTGSGVNGILAARHGAEVLAVDINPDAVAAATLNAAKNGVAHFFTARESDVFEAVDGEFDLVIFDPPFRWFRPRDMLEAAITDENYRAMRAFFKDLPQHLSPTGRVLLFFGTSGDVAFLTSLIEASAMRCEVVASQSLVKEGVRVEYFTYLLTRPR